MVSVIFAYSGKAVINTCRIRWIWWILDFLNEKKLAGLKVWTLTQMADAGRSRVPMHRCNFRRNKNAVKSQIGHFRSFTLAFTPRSPLRCCCSASMLRDEMCWSHLTFCLLLLPGTFLGCWTINLQVVVYCRPFVASYTNFVDIDLVSEYSLRASYPHCYWQTFLKVLNTDLRPIVRKQWYDPDCVAWIHVFQW